MSEPNVNPPTPSAGSTTAPVGSGATSAQQQETLGGLVHQLTTQLPQLIRSEMQLAQAELAQKGKRAGIGIGMFSVAGLLAFYGLGFVFATIALALALVLPGWAAALIVAAVLLIGAGIAGVMGKKKVDEAVPAAPERTISNVKEDIATIKGGDRA